MKSKVYSYFMKNTGASKKEVDYLLSKHNIYNTLVYEKSKYVCVFNIIDGRAYINHLISNKCGILGIRKIASEIKERFKETEHLVYQRCFKVNAKIRVNNINKYIK